MRLPIAIAFTDVFFDIFYFCVFAYEETVDAFVERFFAAAVMDTAASHDGDICAFTDMEIVIYQIVYACFCDQSGNVDIFVLCAGFDVNIDTGVVFLGYDLNVFCGVSAFAVTVVTDIEGTVQRYFCQVCHFRQQFFDYVVKHYLFPP